MFPKYELLSRNVRSGLIEEEHFGIILECSKDKTIRKVGEDNDYPFFQRSCMKPMQLAAVMEIIDAYDLTPQETAICQASHSGEDFHIQTVKNILKKANLEETDLQCPEQMPLNKEARNFLIGKKQNPKSIHNNCSGKHAAILAYCKLKNIDIKNYTDFDHPVQKHIIDFVSKICDFKNFQMTKDGCTLPVIATPLFNLAKGYLEIFTNKKFEKIQTAVIDNPYYAGGHGRVDSEIINCGNKRFAAKVGAGNLCCIADLQEKSCTVFKLIDGDNYARGIIITEFLKKYKNLDTKELSKIFSKDITDEKGNIFGETEVFFNFN